MSLFLFFVVADIVVFVVFIIFLAIVFVFCCGCRVYVQKLCSTMSSRKYVVPKRPSLLMMTMMVIVVVKVVMIVTKITEL